MTQPSRLYIAIRPNQANIASRLAEADRERGEAAEVLFLIPQDRVAEWSAPFAESKHIRCLPRTSPDGAIGPTGWEQFEAANLGRELAAEAPQGVRLMLPHADDHLPALILGNMAQNTNKLTGFERYYEGLSSYTFDATRHGWGAQIEGMLPRHERPGFYANRFIGIREYDDLFGVDSDSRALGIEEVFPTLSDAEVEAEIPAFRAMRAGQLPKTVFAGQCFASDGVTSEGYEKAMTKALLQSGEVGFVARHPRNTILPDSKRIGTTPGGLEKYLGYMKRHGISLVSVFSSTAYAARAFGIETRVVQIPEGQFCADRSHPKAAAHLALYDDIKQRLPEAPITLDSKGQIIPSEDKPKP
ncbi:MAG: hypothetical protein Alpg2KO_13290 [Alphaproteobacteria bacterium]